MIVWLKRLAVPIAAVAVLGMASASAIADTVSYYVQGHFTAGNTGGSLTNTGVGELDNQVILPSGGYIAFVKQSFTYNDLTADGSEIPADFGYFNATAPAVEYLSSTGRTVGFTLQVFQTVPDLTGYPTDNGTFVGEVTGTLRVDPARSTLVMEFSEPFTFVLPDASTGYPPGVVYRIDQYQHTLAAYVLGTPGSQLSGAVAAAPLPGIAWTGMALLGGLGGWRKLRRRQGAAG